MTNRPNVLLVTADQWRGECFSALGHPVVRTPNLDRLAAEGVHFAAHYAQCAPCGPSRASLLTGMYAMNHRSLRNGTPLDARFTNIASEMRRLGYDPALIGYTDTSLDPRGRDPRDPAARTYAGTLPGFTQLVPGSEGDDAWIAELKAKGYAIGATRNEACAPVRGHPGAERRGPTFPPPAYRKEDSETAFTIDHALRFIGRQTAPWFLHLSILQPHPPFAASAPYNALYDPAAVPRFRGFADPADESALHPYAAYMRRHFRDREGHRDVETPEDEAARRQLRATYFGMMTEVDDQWGRLVAGMESLGCYDDTLIVFTSDHGEMLWDHWVLGKEFFFDQAFRIPLIVRLPAGAPAAARGRVVEEFSGSIDVMPTILDLLGAEPPLQCDGRSLAPFLRGETPSRWPTEVFWELDFRDPVNDRPERELGVALDDSSIAIVRGRRHKYVHCAALPPLLFDLEADPDETRNLAGDPAHAPLALAMAQRMLSWRLAKAERTLTGIRLTRNGPVECPRARRFPDAR
ncbi:MAG: alkaline phosphatase family protein [Alphaproteobacteria bacterium]|nr:alkaline phosphatase family protein [Alphaproteobacteria bacterium]